MIRHYLNRFLAVVWLFSCLCLATASASGYGIHAGATAQINQSINVRTGPGNGYKSIGTFFEGGTEISVLTAARDRSGNWWIQVEFSARGKKRRGYVPVSCFNIDAGSLPKENSIGSSVTSAETTALSGPGTEYARYDEQVPAGTEVTVFAYESGYSQIEYHSSSGLVRVWIPDNSL